MPIQVKLSPEKTTTKITEEVIDKAKNEFKAKIKTRPHVKNPKIIVNSKNNRVHAVPKIKLPEPKRVTVAIPEDVENIPDWARIRNERGEEIILDADQQRAVEAAIAGKSFCMIGKAGTGKTTTVQAINLALLQYHSHKIKQVPYRIRGEGRHVDGISIGIIAFANRAANNIRNKCQAHPDLKEIMNHNVTTCHNMLEYTVEFFDDPETGAKRRRYYPQKDELSRLEITHLEVEEGTMIAAGPASLWEQVYKALPAGVQVIILGDPNQLPPVGGKPVLAYAMQQLEVIELTHVHRQALDNPIINQALRCLSGKPVEQQIKNDKGVRILCPSKVLKKKENVKLSTHHFRWGSYSLLKNLLNAGQYDPFQDIILCPNNKLADHIINTTHINAHIAGLLAKAANREVWQINAGYNTVYLSIGDKVMIDKYEGIVVKIDRNPKFIGKEPYPPSVQMNYHGEIIGPDNSLHDIDIDTYNYEALDIDEKVAIAESDNQEDEKGRAASHIVEVELEDKRIVSLKSSGDFGDNVFSLGYALSVHKAQGSEWRNVIVVLHDSARTLLFRELLYTSMTRAVERLDIIAQNYLLNKVIKNPRIKGNTLQDKIEFFNSGYLDQVVDIVPPLVED